MKMKNKLIQSLFAIFMIVAIVSAGFANIVNVTSANSNDDVANAMMLNGLNDKTANTTFPSNTADYANDYTLTEFKEGVGGNIEAKDDSIVLQSPLGDDWYDDVTLNIPIIEIIYPEDREVISEARPTIQAKIFSLDCATNIDASSITVTLEDSRDNKVAGTLSLNPNEDTPEIMISFTPNSDLDYGSYRVTVNGADVNGVSEEIVWGFMATNFVYVNANYYMEYDGGYGDVPDSLYSKGRTESWNDYLADEAVKRTVIDWCWVGQRHFVDRHYYYSGHHHSLGWWWRFYHEGAYSIYSYTLNSKEGCTQAKLRGYLRDLELEEYDEYTGNIRIPFYLEVYIDGVKAGEKLINKGDLNQDVEILLNLNMIKTGTDIEVKLTSNRLKVAANPIPENPPALYNSTLGYSERAGVGAPLKLILYDSNQQNTNVEMHTKQSTIEGSFRTTEYDFGKQVQLKNLTIDANLPGDSKIEVNLYKKETDDTSWEKVGQYTFTFAGQVIELPAGTYAKKVKYGISGTEGIKLIAGDVDNVPVLHSLKLTAVPTPILLVYGWHGDPDRWGLMKHWLEQDNIPVEILNYSSSLHAEKAAKGYLSPKVDEMLETYGVDKIDIIAHSFGGLVSRYYIEKMDGDKNVRKLVMLATPNHGTLLADYFVEGTGKDQNLLNIAIEIARFLMVEKDWGSTKDLRAKKNPFLEQLNRDFNPSALDSKYCVAIGTKPYEGWYVPGIIPKHINSYIKFLPGPDDGLVTVDSARLPGVPLYCTKDDHSSIIEDETVYARIIRPILKEHQPSPVCPCPEQDPYDYQPIPKIAEWLTFGLLMGESYEDDFSISRPIKGFWAGFRIKFCDFDFRLISPSGRVIDPIIAAEDPNISYIANETLDEDRYWYYTVKNPEKGNWTWKIKALDVPEEGENITVMCVEGEIVNVPFAEISTDKREYTTGETMSINITLSNPAEEWQPVYFAWRLDFPDYDLQYWIMIETLHLSPDYEQTFTIPFALGDYGIPFNASWYVALYNTTTLEIVSEDTADWRYVVPGKKAKGEIIPEEIAEEMTKTVKANLTILDEKDRIPR